MKKQEAINIVNREIKAGNTQWKNAKGEWMIGSDHMIIRITPSPLPLPPCKLCGKPAWYAKHAEHEEFRCVNVECGVQGEYDEEEWRKLMS